MDKLFNVVKVRMITEEATPVTHSITTADEVGLDIKISSGKEVINRVKNKVLAVHESDDVPYGVDIRLKDNVMNIPVFALLDGGTVREDVESVPVGYDAPVAGSEVIRTPFILEIYTEQKSGGEVVGYTKLTVTGCKGKPIKKYDIKDDNYFAPELTISSIAKDGESPYKVDRIAVEALPA